MTVGKKMEDIMEPNGAGAWLRSTQQLRTHWSGVITTHIGYAVVLNVAIWSYFLNAYVDSFNASSKGEPLYILLATALSAIVLGAWRLYTHGIDNHIAGLYPDFIFCEGVLRIPPDYGTSAYLIRTVPKVYKILRNKNLRPEEKAKGILDLVKLKRIGDRKHLKIDKFTVAILVGMCAVNTTLQLLQAELQSWFAILYCGGIIFGFYLIWVGSRASQKNPSEGDIGEILSKLKQKSFFKPVVGGGGF